jgi:hypothetical protein
MSHSRKSAAQRAKSLERLKAFQAQATALPPAPPPRPQVVAPPPQSPFDNYDAIRTPEGASWPEDGRHVPYMRWRLPFSTSR